MPYDDGQNDQSPIFSILKKVRKFAISNPGGGQKGWTDQQDSSFGVFEGVLYPVVPILSCLNVFVRPGTNLVLNGQWSQLLQEPVQRTLPLIWTFIICVGIAQIPASEREPFDSSVA